MSLAPGPKAADAPIPEDDVTFRPTVMVHRGKGLGSGTIIASVEGESLVLTASHVVDEKGPITIELFRFNVGAERVRGAAGYPRRVSASIVARDADADLAILRVRGELAFPYVAKVARGEVLPAPRARVTTIGFDKGGRPVGVTTRLRAAERIDLNKGGGPRSFLVTDDPPEVGRSGGGLFRADGALVGVCVGRVSLVEGKTFGLFSALENVRDLIREDAEVEALMARASVKPRSPAR
jgi:S1-C subfamily serine protease